MPAKTLEAHSSRALELLVATALSLVACGPPGYCEGTPDPRDATVHLVISEARARALMATADGGSGLRCVDDCGSVPPSYTHASTCTVGEAVDGGVALTCQFVNGCR